MKKLKARLRALIANPKKDYAQIEQRIQALKAELLEIQKMDNKVEAIVRLFQVTSPLQDTGGFSQTLFKLREKNFGQLDRAIAALEAIQGHIRNAGRCEYGYNRTKPNEAVTAASVYLGDVFGIWTFPASFWLEKQKEMDLQPVNGAWNKRHNRDATVWECINDYQAGNFVRNHVNGLLDKLSLLKTAFA